jgi:hypothetical protein
MSARQAGGQAKQGRWKKEDTARKHFINTVAFPNLRAGVLPTPHDVKMLFLGPLDSKDTPGNDLNYPGMECAYSIWTSGPEINKISQCAVRLTC